MAGSPLLVPLHLDVLVHSEQSHNEGSFAWFEVDYGKLASFEDPLPAAFTQEGAPKPGYGVYLHWALPDALTRGDGNNPKGITFGSVPDRWLIGRFNAAGDTWINKFWVIESDFTGDEGSSVFLDPAQTSTPDAVHSTKIGRPIDITAYKSSPTENSGYLQAVSPGNVAFAAFAPFNHNVFSFVDDDVLNHGSGNGAGYTYLVIGWYSNPEKHDPLRGAANPVGNSIWKDEGAWKAALKEERFAALCEHLKWSVKGEPAAEEVPDHILCHGLVHGVDTSHSNPDQKRFQAQDVQIVVANTAVDALARLIQAEAAQQAREDSNPDQKESWRKAGTDLERLLRAAQYDLLKTLDEPGGQARLEQQIRDHWFGSKASGTRWEVAGRVPQEAGDYPDLPRLSAKQQEALDQRLATLNKAQRQFDDDLNQLAGLQTELYHLWWKRKQAAVSSGRIISGVHIGGHPTLQPENNTAPWDTVISKMADELDAMKPDSLAHKVWQLAWKIQGDAQGLPQNATAEQLADWADKNFSIPAQLAHLKLELKAAATARFYHPSDPVVLIKGLQRARKHGEDGRYNEHGSLSCRLQGQTITGLSNPAVRAVDLPQEGIDLIRPATVICLIWASWLKKHFGLIREMPA